MASTTDTHAGARRRGRTLAVGAAVTLIAIGAVLLLVWSMQRSLIYFPDSSAVPAAEEVLENGQDLTVRTSDGLELGAWFAETSPGAEARDLAVLVAPGNGGNRAARAGLAGHLQDQGFAVLLMDYRGYGGNPGNPTEEGLLKDASANLDALEEQGYPPEQVIYFGESIGGGVIAALLEEQTPAAAVFRSPFTELADIGRHHYPWLPVRALLRDEFPVVSHVAESEAPISVIRAANDSIIPSRFSAEVAAAAPNLVMEHVIDDADHNDPVMFGPEVAAVVARTADALER